MKKKLLSLAWGSSLLLFAAGCETTRPVVEPVTYPTGLQPGNTATVLTGALSYGWSLQSANRDQVEFASSTAARLNQKGFRETNQNPDLLISFRPAFNIFDETGEYVIYEGTAHIEVSRTYDNRTVASENVVQRGKRMLGKEGALRDAKTRLSQASTEWIVSSLTTDALGLAASDVRVGLPSGMGSVDQRMSDYSKLFIREVGSVKGVQRVTSIGQDAATRQLSFRVVFDPTLFPEGILNRLYQLPALGIGSR